MNLSKITQTATANRFNNLQSNSFIEVELSKVYPNPDQPRKKFNDIEDLADSIKVHGLIEPIVVVKKDYNYMIIAGERRFKACQLLDLKAIKVHLIEANEKKILELSLIENIQRDDLSDFEIAKFVGKLMSSGNYPMKRDLAKAIGKSDSYISRVFSVLKLDTSIIEDIEQNKNDLPLSVLDEISRLKDKDLQYEAYTKYQSKQITRDQIKHLRNSKTSTGGSLRRLEEFKTTGQELNKAFSEFDFESSKQYKITIKEI
jgi:ParB/RepB/Spo0J family partition protein